jgi:hypothetical protein
LPLSYKPRKKEFEVSGQTTIRDILKQDATPPQASELFIEQQIESALQIPTISALKTHETCSNTR